MKKALVFIISLLLITITLNAQTQHGYVKTKGRLVSDRTVIAGEKIADVIIQVKGRTAIRSQQNGAFSFPIPAQKFYIQNVIKTGYVLMDPELLTKPFEYSPNEIVLVMETPEEQAEEQLNAAIRIRTTLTSQLQKREREIKKLRDEIRLPLRNIKN